MATQKMVTLATPRTAYAIATNTGSSAIMMALLDEVRSDRLASNGTCTAECGEGVRLELCAETAPIGEFAKPP